MVRPFLNFSRRRCTVIAVVIATVFAVAPATAEITARVDRPDVELNESFTLELTSDDNIDLQPDVSVLEQDFYVGQGSQLSNTTIANGQIRRSKTWSYVLMPKRAGDITIPPIALGKEQSNAVKIVVSEPSYEPPGEAEVFVTTEVDFDETYVQAQLLLTTKIYRSVATRQPALRDPAVSGIEVLQELAGDDRSYEAVIDGTAYAVVERVIAIYPQESGELSLSPARFEARVLRNGRITGRKVYESKPLTVTVLPIPAPPAEFADADWLPARDVTLSESWSRDEDELVAGEPLTRRVTVSALGQLETQIPAPQPPSATGVNVYPDKPELTRRVEAGGIRGVRKDQYAVIGVTPGNVVLPAVELPWWNIGAARWEVARLPERAITVRSSGEASPPVEPPKATTSEVAPPSAAPLATGGFWRRVSELLAALWLVTLFLWWWTSRPKQVRREPPPIPLHKQQSRSLKSARKAAMAGDAAAVRSALLEWSRLQWPDDAPRSLGALAARVNQPLSSELLALSRLSYGPADAEWNGADLAKALRSFAVLDVVSSNRSDALPPLMPQ